MKVRNFLFAILAGSTVAACGGAPSSGLYSVHQPVVTRTNYVLDVNVDGNGAISGREAVRAAEWMEALGLGYGDKIAIDAGDNRNGYGSKQSLAEMASRHGMLISETAPVTPGYIAPGTVRIVVSRSTAAVPSCPDWSTSTDSNFNGGNHSNHGCAMNSNLAAMVADPEDLVRGREDNRNQARDKTKAVDAYRAKAKTTGSAGGN
ncbi:hypothetical protein LPB140_09585 [Sphingorhabdus lutea]|uniref:Pilus assembly protein CpaD n=1 Tax=Sphingorhabdus lutea TaxID=1913578 RepID=A0A1L3JD36_9SPHN|nr:CpaD family pilus assembly protein [Sphingorhabdus lutea]APG62999.1 hypothetical protein LPB140_09585 [Sphingorhabdus lutea]